MIVEITDQAILHLDAIYAYIAKDSELYAKRLLEKLLRRCSQIEEFPYLGRKVPEFDTEEIREILDGKYRIIYRILPEKIHVLAIIHGARLLPNDIIDN